MDAGHQALRRPPDGQGASNRQVQRWAKIFFWVQSILGAAFLISGMPLWFPGSFGAGLLTTMRLLHYLAALGGGLLLIVHVYLGTVAYPGTARGILYGKVSREWAKLHHPLWYREKTSR